MAACTGVGCVGIVSVVTAVAVVLDGNMSAGNGIETVIESRRCPRSNGVTISTIRRDGSGRMVGIGSAIVIIHMARVTFGRCISIVSGQMASFAVINVMPLHQWKKIMQDICVPPSSKRIMAFYAVGTISGDNMVRIFCTGIIIVMTTEAIVTQPVEPQVCFRFMAVDAIQVAVIAHQRKPVLFVNFRNVAHQPVIRSVAAGASIAHRRAMHISMTGQTLGRSLIKN